jgi:hypothetical protein
MWMGSRDANGYGRIRIGGRQGKIYLTHRIAWSLAHSVTSEGLAGIPENQEFHHRCERPACINPSHLELVSRKEHSQKHRTGFCDKGHDLSVVGQTSSGNCRLCMAEYKKVYSLQEEVHARALESNRRYYSRKRADPKWRETSNEYQREYQQAQYATPEGRQRKLKTNAQSLAERMKDPEYAARQREYKAQWMREKRARQRSAIQ